MQPHFLPDGRQRVNVRHVRVAAIRVIFVGIVNRPKHALERQRDARDAVVLEHRQVDDRVADLRQRAAQQAACLAEGGEVVLKTQHVVAKTSDSRTALGDLEAGALQIGVLPVPDDDLGNPRLPQALR